MTAAAPQISLKSDEHTLSVLLAHGSLNKIFLALTDDLAQLLQPPALADWVQQVRTLNDPDGPVGGGDGIYVIQDRPGADGLPQAQFFNADGSLAALCGNGMRTVMRLLMQQHGTAHMQVQVGQNIFRGDAVADLAPGVPGVSLALPAVDFSTSKIPLLTDLEQFIEQRIPALHPTMRFTAVSVPNKHLITIVNNYDEALLVELGEKIAAGMDELPEGINLSFVQPIAEDELFVRTYERGSGLTPACGSGNVASRSVAARLGLVAAQRRVLLRNSGGVAASWLEPDATEPEMPAFEAAGFAAGTGLNGADSRASCRFDWEQARPYLEGNATWMFTAQLDRQGLRTGSNHAPLAMQQFDQEQHDYQQVWQANRDAIAQAGIHLPT